MHDLVADPFARGGWIGRSTQNHTVHLSMMHMRFKHAASLLDYGKIFALGFVHFP
jgi:hypothetical protein